MANDLNTWIGIGRLVRDSELKYSSGGTAICKFSIAVGKKFKKDEQLVEEVSFFDVVLWGKHGETLSSFLVKGKQVAVEGELHQNRWEQDGQSRSKVEINASNVQLLGGGQGHSEAGNSSAESSENPYRRKPESTGSAPAADPQQDFPDDIPF